MNCTELYLKKRKEQVMPVETIFQRADISAPALINPADTTEKRKDFPKICVSTFSDNIIRKFASLENVHQIAELYTANGAMPVYKIRYIDTDIAFFSVKSRSSCLCRRLRGNRGDGCGAFCPVWFLRRT